MNEQAESGAGQPAQNRSSYVDAVLNSDSPKKLIVAGPGTGKSFLFRSYLEQHPGTDLVLTFINNLVEDLADELGDLAVVRTFHSYCKSLLHDLKPGGITADFEYYPPISEFVPIDIGLVRGAHVDSKEVARSLRRNDDSDGLINDFLACGNYYDAVGHDDGVARVVRFLTDHPDRSPRLEHLIVDEVQDFNPLEMALIDLLSNDVDVLAAGDDDQALYVFKEATSEYIRAMAHGGEYEVFELPYCSRCTTVIVDAVSDVLGKAKSTGALDGRLEKSFGCYLPDKAADSEAHPKIIHADCSVSRKNAPYMARYVAEQIKAIPDDHVRESRKAGYPTALVIGPSQFLPEMETVLSNAGGVHVTYERRPDRAVALIHGYRRLMKDPKSRLGWRIVLEFDRFEKQDEVIREAHSTGKELASLIPADFQSKHLAMVQLLRQLELEESVDDALLETLLDAVSMDLLAVQRFLDVLPPEPPPEIPEDIPTARITTLTGAKGLSAAYVFAVGMIDGHLPRNRSSPTDTEICQFIVALTRTRKECHLVSTRRFGKVPTKSSSFIGWIDRDRITTRTVNKAYFS
jgi:superfamily I DNA/RNA helicase